ncbi:MAG: class I SAM-dependent methyltransferase [Bacteroidales bacterium]|nr:class I SAM-dependent methyltransferase [Bacteroidales bacterium]
MITKWDQRYGEHDFVYGKDPNLFFRNFIDSHEAGSILLPAEGEGRNALYAASRGWNVYAVDYSAVGREKALKRARKENLPIHYDEADLNEWSCAESFEYIGLIYAHFPDASRVKLHRKFVAMLKPGGRLFMEAFSKEQIHYNSGGPKDIGMLYSPESLKLDFRDLLIESMEKSVQNVTESVFHSGEASIIRMIAKKE